MLDVKIINKDIKMQNNDDIRKEIFAAASRRAHKSLEGFDKAIKILVNRNKNKENLKL